MDDLVGRGMGAATKLGWSISALVFVLDSTDRRIEQVMQVNYTSKQDMKLVGSTAILHNGKMVELVVLGMAKIVEDLLVTAQRDRMPNNIWRDFDDHPNVGTAKMIRRLANLIKHHESRIVSSRSRDAQALVDNYGFPEGAPIDYWSPRGLIQAPNPCPYYNLLGIQRFCLSVLNRLYRTAFPLPSWEPEEAKVNLTRLWIGDFLDLEASIEARE